MHQIAIDGPAAAGKTTMAKRLAAKLGYLYVDTGAMYRVIGLYMTQKQRNIGDIPSLLKTIAFNIASGPDGQHVYLFGNDVTSELRTPNLSRLASDISAIPEVRNFLLDKQRDIAVANNVVMEGRDIGSVILPDANVKFYLTADLLVRAQRRYHDELSKGFTETDAVKLAEKLKQRDYNDSHRDIAPLKKTPDAILIDNSNLTIAETEAIMLALIRCRIPTT